MQSRDGFSRFVERYPGLSRPVQQNIYAVPKLDSLIDFLTYKLIMTSSGVDFRELPSVPAMLENVEGCLDAPEHVLLLDRARRYFEERLAGNIVLGHSVTKVEERESSVVVDGQPFDFLVDATWGHFSRPPIALYYEPTLLLYYEARAPFPAITLVDGPLCSVYPTEDHQLFTLSSVPYTPLGRYDTAAEALEALDAVNEDTISEKKKLMEEQIRRYVPEFSDIFTYAAPQMSIKTKPIGSVDDRSCYVFKEGRIFSVMSGKVDTIFFATERILALIEAIPEPASFPDSGTLRQEILHRGAIRSLRAR